MSSTQQSGAPLDLSVGAFSEAPPWLVDIDELAWRKGIETLRVRSQEATYALIRRRRLPPLISSLRVGSRLGWAMGWWYLRTRGTTRSRAGLSRRLRLAFEKLGPTYIKLGQIISAGEGVFPAELTDEFRLCRDRVPAVKFSTVRRIVEEDLGAKLSQVFSFFDETPIAAASIAQVHHARLISGEEVVVKVQRPNIDRQVRRDLSVMSWLAPSLVGRIPVAALANPPVLIEVFAETITEELDFRLEAQNMLDVAHILALSEQRALVVPRPHPTLVTQRVLVMERLVGYGWADVDAMVKAGIDTSAVLTDALIAFLEGLVLYGVFHGDLHSGNLLVREDGRVALLDFGITGRLDQEGRRAFMRLVISTAGNDVTQQLNAMRDLGALPRDVDIDMVISDLGLDKPPVDPLTMGADELINQIRDVTKALLGYGARLPKPLMLFVKDVLFIDNALNTMAPQSDILQQILTILSTIQNKHGDRIAKELGLSGAPNAGVDMAGIRASLGLSPDVERITREELQARRALIRKRLESHRRSQAKRENSR
jgi:ubiquinone biosynthesis protein